MISKVTAGAKVFWAIIIVLSWGVFFYFLGRISVTVFKDKKVFSSTTQELNRSLILPDITICSANPFQGYLANEDRRKESKEFIMELID